MASSSPDMPSAIRRQPSTEEVRRFDYRCQEMKAPETSQEDVLRSY